MAKTKNFIKLQKLKNTKISFKKRGGGGGKGKLSPPERVFFSQGMYLPNNRDKNSSRINGNPILNSSNVMNMMTEKRNGNENKSIHYGFNEPLNQSVVKGKTEIRGDKEKENGNGNNSSIHYGFNEPSKNNDTNLSVVPYSNQQRLRTNENLIEFNITPKNEHPKIFRLVHQ